MVLDVRVFLQTSRMGVFPWTMLGLGVSMDWFVWCVSSDWVVWVNSLTCFFGGRSEVMLTIIA